MAKKKKNPPKKASKTPAAPSKKKLYIGLSIAAAALVVLCIFLFRSGPVDKIQRAAKNTFFAKSFTTIFTLTVDGDAVDGTVNASIDPSSRELGLYMTMETRSTSYVCGIYKTDFVVCNRTTEKVDIVDISDRMDSFFEALTKYGQPDWSVLLNLESVDLHETLSKDFDFPALLSAVGKWMGKLNNKNWAQENAGYAVSKSDGITTYSFTPDPYKLATATAPMFRSAFLEKSRYKDLQAYMDNAKYLLSGGKCNFSFQAQGGKLIAADFALEYNKKNITGTFSFIGIGNTRVDTEAIAFYVMNAQK